MLALRSIMMGRYFTDTTASLRVGLPPTGYRRGCPHDAVTASQIPFEDLIILIHLSTTVEDPDDLLKELQVANKDATHDTLLLEPEVCVYSVTSSRDTNPYFASAQAEICLAGFKFKRICKQVDSAYSNVVQMLIYWFNCSTLSQQNIPKRSKKMFWRLKMFFLWLLSSR